MPQEEIDFSIITPVYNGQKYIEETIKSVIKYAAGFKYEYIVIDDGSTDMTSSIVKDYKNKLKLIRQENAGEAIAVNHGFLEARGKFLLVVNDDDPMLTSEILSESLAVLTSNPEIVVAYPDWQIIDSEGIFLSEQVTREFTLENLIGLFICLPGPGAVFRRDVAMRVGGRQTNLKYLSDYDFWLRMSTHGKFQRIPKLLAQWRQHPGSTSTSSRGLAMAKERIEVMENFLLTSTLSQNMRRQARAHAYYRAAVLRYFSRDVPGRRWLIKSLLIRRGWVEELRFREAVYILGAPMTEIIWKHAKSVLHLSENR